MSVVKRFVFVLVLGVALSAQQRPSQPQGLHFEPTAQEIESPGRIEAWDSRNRILHIVPNADVLICLPHSTPAPGGGTLDHEDCFTRENWVRKAH